MGKQSGKYDDIIDMERPGTKRPRMSRGDRAKIFAPFAALRGFEDAIEETADDHRSSHEERAMIQKNISKYNEEV